MSATTGAVDIVQAGAMPWGASLTSHRAGTMRHKQLFEGVEGTPDNYIFVLADEGSDYYSPRHRHLWDQVRFCLEGWVPIGGDDRLGAGEIGYFPEGVRYGPQKGGSDRVVLLLQIGGPSGNGFMSIDQTLRGRAELAEIGEFEGGVYRRPEPGPGVNRDAYEAIWEHEFGSVPDYPEPCFPQPAVLRPHDLPWSPVEDRPGVALRHLAAFEPRGLTLDMYRIDPGATHTIDPSDELRLVFVTEGDGAVADTTYAAHTALRLPPGAGAGFEAEATSELLVIGVRPLAAATSRVDPAAP